MDLLWFTTTSIISYLLATLFQIFRLCGARKSVRRSMILALVFLAVILHANLLYHWIDVGSGQNLTLFNLLSQTLWLMCVLLLIMAIRISIENLGVIIFPLTAISIGLATFFPGAHIVHLHQDIRQFIHVLLSLMAFSILCLAVAQAVLVAIQHHWLHRSRRMMFMTNMLPPLESMETFLFQMIGLGFVLLSVLIISSFISFAGSFTFYMLEKTILAILAWTVFAALLLGRFCYGWRGPTAIRWTLSGMALLILSYGGSRLFPLFLRA